MESLYVHPNFNKFVLLHPNTDAILAPPESSIPFFPTRSESSKPPAQMLSLYRCSQLGSIECNTYVSNDSNAVCGSCKNKLSIPMSFIPTAGSSGSVKEEVTFMITDDLVVKPISGISSVMLLNKLNIKELTDVEEKIVYVGLHEGIMILKASMGSKSVFTDVFLKNKPQVPNDDDDKEDESEWDFDEEDTQESSSEEDSDEEPAAIWSKMFSDV